MRNPHSWNIVHVALCLLLLGGVRGAYPGISGTAVTVQSTGEWGSGNIVLIDLPSQDKKVLFSGSAVGPCISPDGSRVAFFVNVNGGQQLCHMPIDGSTGDTVNTGVYLPSKRGGWRDGADGCWHNEKSNSRSCVYWLDLDNAMGSGEYFYWASMFR